MRRATSAFVLAMCLLALEAHAQETTAIAHVRSTHAALDERIDAELSTLGYEVKAVDALEGADLGGLAQQNGAVGAIRVDDDAIELWVDPHRAGAAPIHERIAARDRNVGAVVALETMRAHLLAVRPPRVEAPAPSAPPPQPPPVEAPPVSRPSEPWLWAHAAFGAEASSGGLSVAPDVLLELRAEPRGWLGIGAFGAFTPAITHVEGSEGEATVRRTLAGLTVDARWHASPLTLSVGAGAALAVLSLHGRASTTDYAGADATSTTLGPLLRASAAFDLAAAWRVRAALASGVTFPRAAVSFAGREIADWGRPFALATLGIEWGIAP